MEASRRDLGEMLPADEMARSAAGVAMSVSVTATIQSRYSPRALSAGTSRSSPRAIRPDTTAGASCSGAGRSNGRINSRGSGSSLSQRAMQSGRGAKSRNRAARAAL